MFKRLRTALRSRSSTVGTIAVVAGLVFVTAIAVTIMIVSSQTPAPPVGQPRFPGYTPAPTTSAATFTPAPAGTRAVFVGDSWTVGYGADDPTSQGWAPVSAIALRWNATYLGESGAGYGQANDAGVTFESAVAAQPVDQGVRVVVIQGGTNDVGPDREKQIPAGFAATLAAARQKWPAAQMVIVGPMSPSARYDTDTSATDALLKGLAFRAQVPYLDAAASNWLPAAQRTVLINQQVNHPSTAGYAAIARSFVAAVQ